MPSDALKLSHPGLFVSSFYVKLAVSPCGSWLASGSSGGGIYLWDVASRSSPQRQAVELKSAGREVSAVDWANDIVCLLLSRLYHLSDYVVSSPRAVMMEQCGFGDLTKRLPSCARQLRRTVDGAGYGVPKTHTTMLLLSADVPRPSSEIKSCDHVIMSLKCRGKRMMRHC